MLIPNGLFESVWGTSMAHNDIGVLNMSGLVPFLEHILTAMPSGMFPVLSGDDIFNDCSVIMNITKIVASGGEKATKKLQLNSKGIRQGIELAYGLYFNWFACLKNKRAFKLLNKGEYAYRLAINSFLCIIALYV